MQMSEVVRLGGQQCDAEACGILVWAQSEGSLWWPAEALDPFQMPPGKQLPPAALAGQSRLSHGLLLRKCNVQTSLQTANIAYALRKVHV